MSSSLPSPSSITASLPQLRETLASLETYKLPERFKPLNTNNNNDNDDNGTSSPTGTTRTTTGIIDPKLFQRYLKAKESYLRKQMGNAFLEHLSSIQFQQNNHNSTSATTISSIIHDDKENILNSSSNIQINLPLPNKPTMEEIQELQNYKKEVINDLIHNIKTVRSSYDDVYQMYKLLQDKKDDIKNLIESLEQQNKQQHQRVENKDDDNEKNIAYYDTNTVTMNIDDDDDGGDDDDDTIQESELALEEARLKALREKKAQLEQRLHKLQLEKELIVNNIQNDKQQVRDMIASRTIHGVDGGENVPDNNDDNDIFKDIPSMEAIKTETQKLEEQAKMYQDMAEYYDSMKCAMEVIGGMKILSITPLVSSQDAKNEGSNNDNGDAICLKVLLLDRHIINISLTNQVSPSNKNQQNQHQHMLNYRVSEAKFETSTTITDARNDEELNQQDDDRHNKSSPIVMTIPPLDDLVSLSKNMKPLHDIRFILREAMARIRILTQRVDELGQLRLKYLTKITNPLKNRITFGYGGEYQEIICSLPCQITVVLRLTCDCPVLDGSVYIHQLVGAGGWDSSCLGRMKDKVNQLKNFRSPVQIMECLDVEIKRVVDDEGVTLPKTPTLPIRQRK